MDLHNQDKNIFIWSDFTPLSNSVIIKNKNPSISSKSLYRNGNVFLKVHLKLLVAMGENSFLMNSLVFYKNLNLKISTTQRESP